MWPSRDIAWSTGPKNCSLFTLDLIPQSSLCIITNYIYSWSSSWWAAMQLLRRHQDSWLTMQWFRPCQPTIRGGRDWSTPDPFPPRPGSCRPWSEDSWSKTQVEVCGIPVGPKSGYFLFEPWDFICSNLFPKQVISFSKSTGLFSCCNLLFLFNARSDHTPLQPWCLPNGPSLSQAKREGLLSCSVKSCRAR